MESKKLVNVLQSHSIDAEGRLGTDNDINIVCPSGYKTPLEDVYGLVKNYFEREGFKLDEEIPSSPDEFYMKKERKSLIGILSDIMGNYHLTVSILD